MIYIVEVRTFLSILEIFYAYSERMRQKNPGSNNYKIRKGSIIIELSAAKDFLVFHR